MSGKTQTIKVVKASNATTTVKKVREYISTSIESANDVQAESLKNWIIRPTRRDRDKAIMASERIAIMKELEGILA